MFQTITFQNRVGSNSAGTVRHVKCGEERPSCSQCVSTGRTCDGYQYELARTAGVATIGQIKPQSPPSTTMNEWELRSLQFFQERTASQMSGFFSRSFWSELVPQIAHAEPSILHALVALSNFHEQFMLLDKSDHDARSRSGLHHYNLAIRTLLAPQARSESLLMGLLCCVLFISTELLQGNILSAIRLAKSGKAILSDIRDIRSSIEGQSSLQSLRTELNLQLVRLDFQVAAMSNRRYSEFLFDTCSDASTPHPTAVFKLASVLEARRRYEEINRAWIRHVWCCQRSGVQLDLSLFSDLLGHWDRAFEDLKAREHEYHAPDRREIAFLEMNRRQFEISFAMAAIVPGKESSIKFWDDKTSLLNETLDHAAIAVDLSEDTSSSSPSFSLDSGINVHLYTVAYRCRDPVIRRRAIAMLRSANRHEGLWRSDLVAYVAERIVTLEEEGLTVRSCRDVPDEARLKDLILDFDPTERRANVRYVQKDRIVDEVLSWQESASL
ncbi:hypothetical protein MMC10_002077 [Thelotrema lepadinum]|nr:hypothetical protein [Thelotrema lepadinum]